MTDDQNHDQIHEKISHHDGKALPSTLARRDADAELQQLEGFLRHKPSKLPAPAAVAPQKQHIPWLRVLPWALTGALLASMAGTALFYKPVSLLDNLYQKRDALAQMRIHLLEAGEAEKNAVLAIKPDSANAFVTKARQSVAEVETARARFASLSAQDKIPAQVEQLKRFDASWEQYRRLDQTLLGLAALQTNLKAKSLSQTQAAQALDRFETGLNQLAAQHADRPQLVDLAHRAEIAMLKIQVLQWPHIDSGSDSEMAAYESKMHKAEATARQALQTLAGLAPADADLHQADRAFDSYMRTNAQVVSFSRQNTNVRSVELTLGKKMLIDSACLANLDSLTQVVQEQEFKATR